MPSICTDYREEVESSIKRRQDFIAKSRENEAERYNPQKNEPSGNHIILTKRLFDHTRKTMPSFFTYDKQDKCWRCPNGFKINIAE